MPRVADLDRGNLPVPVGKKAEMLEPADKASRDFDRGGLRELDQRVEQMNGLTRHGRDELRALPRDGTTSTVRSRRLPAGDTPRRLTVYRQRILNTQKTALDRDRVPVRARRAMAQVFAGSGAELATLNDTLATHVGDIDAMDEATARTVRRLDRVLRMAEAHNQADNIVYTPIKTPAGVNSGNVHSWLSRQFPDNTEVNFDRYTVTSHHARQADSAGPSDWRPMCEIVTRRGAYVGKAPKGSDTHTDGSHLLPRALRLRCVGVTTVPVTRSDGTQYPRLVLQLEDLDDHAE